MRWRLDDLEAFCATIESGGVTAAATRLSLPKSSVSKALSRLEEELGLRLIERSSRRMRVTPEGTALHRHAASILEAAREADAMMQGLRVAPSGRVSLELPAAFAREIVAPRLAEFAAAYPEIVLELIVPSRGDRQGGTDCDLAVVTGPQPDSALIRKVLLGGRLIWVASRAFARRHGLSDAPPTDFDAIRIIESRFGDGGVGLEVDGTPRKLHLPPRTLRVNDPLSVREAVSGGLGVSFLPERYCETALRHGLLVEVWRRIRFAEGAAQVAVVFSSNRLLSPRFRAVIDFLETICRQPGGLSPPA